MLIFWPAFNLLINETEIWVRYLLFPFVVLGPTAIKLYQVSFCFTVHYNCASLPRWCSILFIVINFHPVLHRLLTLGTLFCLHPLLRVRRVQGVAHCSSGAPSFSRFPLGVAVRNGGARSNSNKHERNPGKPIRNYELSDGGTKTPRLKLCILTMRVQARLWVLICKVNLWF